MKININKIQAAEIQLNETIYLFFDNAHPLVIETLIGAVIGILRPIGKKFDIRATLHDSDIIKPEYKKEWIGKYLHKAQNFCKHSDRDQEDLLIYETKMVPFHIYEACHLFRHISSDRCLKYRQSTAGLMYEMWFGLKYPQLLKDQKEFANFLKTTGVPEGFTVTNIELIKLAADNYRIKLREEA